MKNKTDGANFETLQLVALGANVSAQGCTLEQALSQAVKAVAKAGFSIRAVSRFFQTPCFPKDAGPDYVNAAVMLDSPCGAAQTLERLHIIEANFGRERVQRWAQRTLDLDLIAVGDAVLPDRIRFDAWYTLDPALQAKAAPDELILPHPRLQDRAFVLVPLADIAPNWQHPVLGKTIRELLAEIPSEEVAEVKPI